MIPYKARKRGEDPPPTLREEWNAFLDYYEEQVFVPSKGKITVQLAKPIRVEMVPEYGHTLLYLSGSSYRGEIYIKKHRERLAHVGILLSYADLERRGCTWQRLVDLREVERED